MATIRLDLRPSVGEDDEHNLQAGLAEFEQHLTKRGFVRFNPYPYDPDKQVPRRYFWLRRGWLTPAQQIKLAQRASHLHHSGGFRITQLEG